MCGVGLRIWYVPCSQVLQFEANVIPKLGFVLSDAGTEYIARTGAQHVQ